MATTSDGRRYIRPVAGSGLFHSPKPQQYSQETKNFLKLIMEESRLTMLQRRTLNDALKNGNSLPAQPPMAHGPQQASVINAPNLQLLYGQRRTKEAIMMSGAYERDQYVPKLPIVDKTEMKLSLQDKMAYGKEMPRTPKHKVRKCAVRKEEPEVDRFEELVQEVDERIEFLQDMTKLGQGQKYKQQIDQEIACKLREMESLDRQRSKQLREIMNKSNKKYGALSKRQEGLVHTS